MNPRRRTRGDRWRLAGIQAALVALTACGGSGSGAGQSRVATANGAAVSGAPTVEIARVVNQPLHIALSLPGELNPYQTVAIFPRVNAFVNTIPVDRGSRLHAGDVIAVLEAPELAAQRAEAQSKVQGAQALLSAAISRADADAGTFDRLKTAAATPGVVAGNDVLLAQKAAESDQGQVAAARQNVEAARHALAAVGEMERYLTVTAPFDGVVIERNVHPGALVGPASGPGASTPIVRLIENDRLRLVVPVPEAYTASVATGAEVGFTVAAYPGEVFSGRVARIAHAVDVSTRTMAVELDVKNHDARLAPGTFCQVRWVVQRTESSLQVPSGSVASTSARTFVVRIRQGRTEWVDVKTGLTSGPLVEVFGDLRAGDAIAAHGTDEIRAGTDVRIKEARPAA
jgi:membrane fusion protein (multidrug efflux system)